MTEDTIAKIREHAKTEAPKECCGVIVRDRDREKYIRLTNTHSNPKQFFRIAPEEWVVAVGSGIDALSIVHSHVTALPKPSLADKVMCEESNLPWHIYSLVTDTCTYLAPSGFKVPLLGREFIFGVLDCFSLIRDYYKLNLGIDFPNYAREDGFWKRNEHLYEDNYAAEGFYPVRDLKAHDLILMKIGQSIVANHAAIYVGGGNIMHHMTNRLSCLNPYGGYWMKNAYMYLRNKRVI
jgi:proteasome lid subunit RPN8/RPN11